MSNTQYPMTKGTDVAPFVIGHSFVIRHSEFVIPRRGRMVTEIVIVEPVLVAEPAESRLDVAARLLDRAVQGGAADPNVPYLLAMAYKRQGKLAEARTALRRIAKP